VAAAEAHRLDEARRLIREVRYRVTINSIPTSAPTYVHVTVDRQQGYQRLDRVKEEQQLSRELFNEELARARSAIERARLVASILGLGGELEEALAYVVHLCEKAA
jgi:hypothetical protein